MGQVPTKPLISCTKVDLFYMRLVCSMGHVPTKPLVLWTKVDLSEGSILNGTCSNKNLSFCVPYLSSSICWTERFEKDSSFRRKLGQK